MDGVYVYIICTQPKYIHLNICMSNKLHIRDIPIASKSEYKTNIQ